MINKKKKKLLIEFVDSKCENCQKIFKDSELEIHRIRRGYLGGVYTDMRNLKVLCFKCHKLIHSREFRA